MTEEAKSSVREARRVARLAREIVSENSGPWKQIEGLAAKYPEIALLLALAAGILAGRAVARD